jgi:hypothetical protein
MIFWDIYETKELYKTGFLKNVVSCKSKFCIGELTIIKFEPLLPCKSQPLKIQAYSKEF